MTKTVIAKFRDFIGTQSSDIFDLYTYNIVDFRRTARCRRKGPSHHFFVGGVAVASATKMRTRTGRVYFAVNWYDRRINAVFDAILFQSRRDPDCRILVGPRQRCRQPETIDKARAVVVLATVKTLLDGTDEQETGQGDLPSA